MYDLSEVLHELDATKAAVRERQLELSKAVRALSCSCCSSRSLRIFEAKSHKMNQATQLYLRAVGRFNVACQTGPYPNC